MRPPQPLQPEATRGGSLTAWRLGTGWFGLPVVAETYDGFLSDIDGHHVTEDHTHAAIRAASPGPVAEGCVGGGTGMLTARFKGGIGTASRVVSVGSDTFTVGTLVQSNYGDRREFR